MDKMQKNPNKWENNFYTSKSDIKHSWNLITKYKQPH